MRSKIGKRAIAKKAWAPLLGVLVVGGLCYSLKLEGASVPGQGSDKERALIRDNAAGVPIVSVSGSGKRVTFGKVPKSEYPFAPPVVVDPFNDEGNAYRKRTGATGPIPLQQVSGGAVAAVGCSFYIDCDDGNPCTQDICDIGPGAPAGSGTCKNDPVGNESAAAPEADGTCDDGVFCNGAERCSGAVLFHCLGTCVGGPNNLQPCATDAANFDNCPIGSCNTKKCVGGPNNNLACTYDSSCASTLGTCAVADPTPCPGLTDPPTSTLCNEITNSCQAPCASDANCADPTATAATDACTLDYCCISGSYTRKTCTGGPKVGALCDGTNPTQCLGSPCGNNVSVPCDVNGTCVRGNPCGPGADCTNRFCDGGPPAFANQPCVTNNDCGPPGEDQGVCSDGTICQSGRCCLTGSCEKRPYGECAAVVGSKKWFPGDTRRLAGPGTICPGGVTCPVYGAGIGELGNLTVVAGPTSLSPFNNLMSGAPLRKLGDDYDFGPTPALITLSDLRFVGGVDNISNSRTSFEFYDENGVFIEDIFFITNVNVIAVQDVQMEVNNTPFDIPAKGFVVAHVHQAFATPDISSLGEFFWLATDVVDHGANDPLNLYVDTDLSGSPVVTANFLKACAGGVRKDAPCGSDANCPGSTCTSRPGVLAFELEGAAQAVVPNGACCDNLGVCTQNLEWVCTGLEKSFLGVGQTCDQCSDDSQNLGANCTQDGPTCQAVGTPVCTGGPNLGLGCASDANCPGPGVCLGGSNPGAVCPATACAGGGLCSAACVNGGANDGMTCTDDDDCPGRCRAGTNAGRTCSTVPTCQGGANNGLACTLNINCPGVCVGGSNPGAVCPATACAGGGVCSARCNSCPNSTCSDRCFEGCKLCFGGDNDGLPCPANDCAPGGGVCQGSCVPACGQGACCDTAGAGEGDCTIVANAGACVGSFLGFGSSCVPNCCEQPLAGYTGRDTCGAAIVHPMLLPSPGNEITITITGNNSTASSFKHCVGGANNGALCDFPPDCASPGVCTIDDLCNPPSVPGAELGWFEAFSINGCAYMRIDDCCTDANPATPNIREPKIPSFRILYDSCPCGQTIFGKRDPNNPNDAADGRGAPFCAEDNAWATHGPLRAGTYYKPINSGLGGAFGKYQLHITAKACPVAACCHNICPSVSGPACTTNAQCTQPNGEVCINGGCQELCEKDSDCSVGQCTSTCELLNILDCQDISGAFLAPPNRGTAVTFCTGACSTGSCCTGQGVCTDEFPAGDPTLDIDNCDTLNGVYVGGFKCFGGTCNGGTRDNLSCQVAAQCPGGSCEGDAQSLLQATPCPVCDIGGADNCQFFDDSVGIRSSDLTLPGGARCADDFTPNGTAISAVCAWGTYQAGDATGNAIDCADTSTDNFTVTIYNSDAVTGLPGTVKGSSAATGANVARALQFPTTYQDLNQIRVFAYKLTLDSQISGMTAGTKYWLEVNNTTNVPAIQNPNCLWTWMAVDFVYNDYSAAGASPGYGIGAGRTGDFAWCVDVNLIPSPAPERACCDCQGNCTNKTKRACDISGNSWHVEGTCGTYTCVGGSPKNDNCSNVVAGLLGNTAIGEGVYVWDNHCCSTDGPNPLPDELGGASMASDVWFKFVSDCPASSEVAIGTCASGTANGGGIDTYIGVYHNTASPTVCACPTAENNAALLWPNGLANDEGCTGILIGGGGVLQTDVGNAADNVDPGECFLVRVGGFAGQGSEVGTGTVVIDCTGLPTPSPLTKGVDDVCVGAPNAGLPCAQNSDCSPGVCRNKNRFITAEVPATATSNGIKVKLVNIDAGSAATPANYNGTDRWVGVPTIGVSDGAGYPALNVGRLQCTFQSMNWGAVGRLHMYGETVVPGSRYEASSCNPQASCSAPLTLATGRFGDVILPTPTVNFQDVNSIIATFQGSPTRPSKTRAKLANLVVNPGAAASFQDVGACVAAFQSKPYRLVVPAVPPTCP